jgi:hypothetical protein
MPSRTASLRSSLMLSCVKPGQRLAVVELHLLDQRQLVLLRILSRVSTAHIAAVSSVCGAMCFPRIFPAL